MLTNIFEIRLSRQGDTGDSRKEMAVGRSALGEHILLHRAKGAYKVMGNIFPLGSRGNACFGITLSLVVLPAANVTYIFHGFYLR